MIGPHHLLIGLAGLSAAAPWSAPKFPQWSPGKHPDHPGWNHEQYVITSTYRARPSSEPLLISQALYSSTTTSFVEQTIPISLSHRI